MLDAMLEKEKQQMPKRKPSKKKLRATSLPRPSPKRTLSKGRLSASKQSLPGLVIGHKTAVELWIEQQKSSKDSLTKPFE